MTQQRKRFFITGTDTEVGKTFTTVALLNALKQQGYRTLGLKPVAAGCELRAGEWVNDDALQIIDAMTEPMPYQQVNPFALQAAIAPHIAAQQEERRLSVQRIVGVIRGALMTSAEVTLIEGAGGWLVPLNERETLADVVRELQIPVILVVGMRLGCLNHALLTAQAIRNSGLPLAAWVGNCIAPEMPGLQQNIQTLQQFLRSPCLGVLPFAANADPVAVQSELNVAPLLSGHQAS